jgi:hypothetical protein
MVEEREAVDIGAGNCMRTGNGKASYTEIGVRDYQQHMEQGTGKRT